MNTKITILGAGISGLATAYWLNKEGFDITILEAGSEPGGSMITEKEGDFLIDFGPNSGLETTPVIRKLVDEIGLSDQMIYANEEGDKRYILRDGKLNPLPTGGAAFFKSKLFSTAGKLRLMKEPFVGKSEDGYYQSIAQFVERRLGKEFLDYAIDPFVSGVFAGDPSKLSVKSAFPKLYRLEELYGGLIKGMIRGARERKKSTEQSKQNAKMFSFINGMQSFPVAIAEKLKGKINYNCNIEKVSKSKSGYKVSYKLGGKMKNIESEYILSTLPAEATSKIFSAIDPKLSEHLDDIYYPPVMVLYLGYKKEAIGHPLDGFGYLIPSKEKRKFLGAIWSSVIFPNRASEDMAAFTLFVGGARSPQIFEKDRDELIQEVLAQFNPIMDVKEEPVLIKHKLWKKAIPQYNLGYIEHENYFNKFEKENQGIFLSGNFRGGISVGDCIKNSDLVANRIVDFIKNK